MNELQKKLARRRCLNGEDGLASNNDNNAPFIPSKTDESPRDIPKLESRKSANFIKREHSTSSSATDELQQKLARRRTANGEAFLGNEKDMENVVDSSPVISRPVSIDHVDSTSPRIAAQADLTKIKIDKEIEESRPILSEDSQQIQPVISKSFDNPTLEEKESGQVPVIEAELKGKENVGEEHGDEQSYSEDPTESSIPCELSVTHIELSNGENNEKREPENPNEDIFKSAEEMLNMIDQELDSFQLHSNGHSLLQQGFARIKKPSSDIFEDDEANLFSKKSDPFMSSALLPDETEVKNNDVSGRIDSSKLSAHCDANIADTLSVDDDDPDDDDEDSHGQEKAHLLTAAQTRPSPRAIRSSSHGSARASSKDSTPVDLNHSSQPPSLSSFNAPPPPAPFPISSTGVISRGTSPKPSNSSLKKVSSGHASPKTNASNNVSTTPMSPDKWYPGKYLLGGRWGGSRHKIDMNTEQAQSLYNDLIASGDKPALSSGSSKSRQSSITEKSLSAKTASKVNLTANVSDSSSLLAENQRLKLEIVRLQRLLEEKQAVIDAYELSESLRTGALSSNKTGEISNIPIKTSDSGKTNPQLAIGILSETNLSGKKLVGFENVLGVTGLESLEPGQGFDDDDDTQDGGFEAGSGLFLGQHHHLRHSMAGSRGVSTKPNFDALLDSPAAVSRSDIHSNTVHPDDGLSALLRSDNEEGGSGNILHFNPRTVGREEDLVRSFNFAASSGRNATNGTNEHPDEEGETEDDENGDEDPLALSYEAFLQLFAKSADLQFITKAFILSVLGPNGDATPPVRMVKLDYVFYGTHKLDERCRQFFEEIDRRLKQDSCFRSLNDEQLICAHDGIEQYVMHRIGQHAYKLTETVEEDQLLMRRMKVLSTFLTPDHLEIPPAFFQEDMLSQAGQELKAINNFRTPGDKVACIVRCVTIIFRSLSVARKRQEQALYLQQQEKLGASSTDVIAPVDSNVNTVTENRENGEEDEEKPKLALAGADDFLPLFIWVVLQSKIPRLVSNAEYIHMYLNPKRLMGKSGYCLINLRSAIDFVTYVEASSLKIDPEYFSAKVQIAESRLKRDDI